MENLQKLIESVSLTKDSVVNPAIPTELVQNIRDVSGELAPLVLKELSEKLPFFAELDAKKRANIGLMVQATIRHFLNWIEQPDRYEISIHESFDTSSLNFVEGLSLQQTVAILNTSQAFFEKACGAINKYEEAVPALMMGVLRYSRELGFEVAAMFAAAAERRGAWDVRIESALVDAIVRGAKPEEISSFSSTLVWDATKPVVSVVGRPLQQEDSSDPVPLIHSLSKLMGRRALAAVQGQHVVVITDASEDELLQDTCPLYDAFSDDQIIVGTTSKSLETATRSTHEAFAALRMAQQMPLTPHIASANMFLPERAISGDPLAIERLFEQTIKPLEKHATEAIRNTLRLYLSIDGGVEECARQLYVHPNTVRYRLKRVAEITGMDPLDSRERFALRIANVLGMMEDQTEHSANSW